MKFILNQDYKNSLCNFSKRFTVSDKSNDAVQRESVMHWILNISANDKLSFKHFLDNLGENKFHEAIWKNKNIHNNYNEDIEEKKIKKKK